MINVERRETENYISTDVLTTILHALIGNRNRV